MAARTQSQIYSILVNNYVALAAAANITLNPVAFGTAAQWANPPFMSMYNLQGLFMWIVAGGAAITEQLWDAFTVDIEALVAIASPQTGPWLQDQMFKFQYDATTPQIIEFDPVNFAPYYTTVDATKRIITNCSVVPGTFGTTNVKTAKGGSAPVPLSSGERDAAQSYANTLTVPGVLINVISENADKLYCGLTVVYVGMYSAVIQATVIAAINSYFRNIPFDGNVTMNGLIESVLSVPGVKRCILNNVNLRADATTFVPGVNNMVAGNDWIIDAANLAAGYVVGETTSGYTLSDSITYQPE